jgi:Zn-dependent M32 family carboxypeptidase
MEIRMKEHEMLLILKEKFHLINEMLNKFESIIATKDLETLLEKVQNNLLLVSSQNGDVFNLIPISPLSSNSINSFELKEEMKAMIELMNYSKEIAIQLVVTRGVIEADKLVIEGLLGLLEEKK